MICECCKKAEGKEVDVMGEKMVLCPDCEWPLDDIKKANLQGDAGMVLWAKLEAQRLLDKAKVVKRVK